MWLARLRAGDAVKHSLGVGRSAWVHVAEGDVNINGHRLGGGDAMAMSEEPEVAMSARGDAQVLLFDLN